MKKAKIFAICIGSVLLVLAIVLAILRTYSFSTAVRFANLDPNSISYVEELGMDNNGDEFCVFQTQTTSGNLALAYATRDKLGFWHIDRIKEASMTQKYTALGWVESAGIRRFSYLETPVFEDEWHFVYCGDDAVGNIKLLPEQLPPNSTVNIQQTGENYLIHMIIFSSQAFDVETLDLRAFLKQNGCVAE